MRWVGSWRGAVPTSDMWSFYDSAAVGSGGKSSGARKNCWSVFVLVMVVRWWIASRPELNSESSVM